MNVLKKEAQESGRLVKPNIGQMERGEVPKVKPVAQEQKDNKFRAFDVLKDVVAQCGPTADCMGCKYTLMNRG